MLLDVANEHEALMQFLYLAPVGLVQLATDGEIAMINPVSAQLLMPLSRDGNLTNLFDTLENVAPDLRHQASAYTAPYGLVCDALQLHLGVRARGTSEPQYLSLSLLKLDGQRLMAVLQDVTQQVRRERLLRQSEAWLNAILTGISDYALVSLDSSGRIDEWNPSIGRVTGYNAEQVVGRTYALFSPEDAITPERVLDRLREADANGWSLDDGWRQRADGSHFWGSALIAPLYGRKEVGMGDAGGLHPEEPAYCLVLRDISEKREASEVQRKATSTDHLTGVANRRAFFEAAELELERWQRAPRPLSLILFDADHFKHINDSHGHAAGDAVLRDFAQLLGSRFRPVDVIARIGGEEFAVLLPSTDVTAAAQAAERLRLAVEAQQVVVDGTPITYRVSGGVAQVDGDIADLEALLKRADLALYAAKEAGRNRIRQWTGTTLHAGSH